MKILFYLFLITGLVSCGDSTVTDPVLVFTNKYSMDLDGATGHLDVGSTSDLMGATYSSISFSTWVR